MTVFLRSKEAVLSTILFAMFSVTACYALRIPARSMSNIDRIGSYLLRNAVNDKKEPDIPKTLSPDQEKEILSKLQSHQSRAPKLTASEAIRTLLHNSHGFGVITTHSLQFPGFPTGSVVAYAMDEDGKPYFGFSNLGAQTKDLLADGRCTLVVAAKSFKGLDDARVSIVGTVTKVLDESKIPLLRSQYLKKHVGAYWVDFG